MLDNTNGSLPYLFDGCDGIHLADFTSKAFDFYPYVGSFLYYLIPVVRELRWCGVWIVFDVGRNHLSSIRVKRGLPPVLTYLSGYENGERANVHKETGLLNRGDDSIELEQDLVSKTAAVKTDGFLTVSPLKGLQTTALK